MNLGVTPMYCIERAGSEPAVLCIHGFCQSSAFWAPTLDRLGGEGVRCLAPDLPGFGGSASLPGPYTVEAYADRLADLLNARGLQPVMVVGGSMGGAVAQHFALRHPTRLVRLVLVSSGGAGVGAAAGQARANAMAAAPWDAAAAKSIAAKWFSRFPEPAELQKYEEIAHSASQPAAVEASRSNAESQTLDRLGEIKVPTLIIQGREDKLRPPEQGALMRDRIPRARFEILEKCGHSPQLEAPEAFYNVVIPFLLAGR